MDNKKVNLTLKLNKSISNLSSGSDMGAPFTPLDQTLKTPVDTPKLHPQFGGPGLLSNNNQNGFYFAPPPPVSNNNQMYSNPAYNESDDILTDIDDVGGSNFKSTRNYTLHFTHTFDQLVLSIYSYILSLPTTTPFSGAIPPSGLVSKVANETMNNLITSISSMNPPLYDHQSIINLDYLRNQHFQPIFLQLIRKRLLDLCNYNHANNSANDKTIIGNNNSYNININNINNNSNRLPDSTTISVTSNTGLRQSSISNLSLNELNISNYNSQQTNPTNGTGPAQPPALNRSRSSSLSLRKHSLTRNNSYTSNNWLHVGNINSIRPTTSGGNNSNNGPINENFNMSTDSLQSIQDYVPQSYINRSATNGSGGSFNSMMMDYQTPPNSNKGSVSGPTMTPPHSNNQTIQNTINHGHNATHSDLDDFHLYQQQQQQQQQNQQQRSRSSSRGTNSFPHPLTINTETANIQALNALNGVTTPLGLNSFRGGYNSNVQANGLTLDSPFMSATTPSDDFGYFSNGFNQFQPPVNQNPSQVQSQNQVQNQNQILQPPTSAGSMVSSNASSFYGSGGESPVLSANSDATLSDSSRGIANLANQFTLSEKKRDSLKMKRGIH
ncbi:DNA-binding proteins Bright/BRCAA1/RBP1 [Scheffersomyces coipomensis]|uniref:DNA-binding proteins Bright/BRCAA1/RBP1 n=1 Tax=Scheffersomyces coipomensis TaxID=1788519 RepID=UPI00315CC331